MPTASKPKSKPSKAEPAEPRAPQRMVIVTGGASGIGFAIAKHLANQRARIALLDQNAELVEKAAEDLGPETIPLTLDITHERAVMDAIDTIAQTHGRVDAVVNSAGIARDLPARETTADLFRKILDVNVVGTFNVSRAALPYLSKSKGSIVNMTSVAGLRGSKGRAAYGASKAAVINLTHVLANEWAPLGVRVNALAPGPIDTPLIAKLHTADDRKLWQRYVPQRRYGAPEDIAAAAAFLLDNDRAGFITGAVLPVDGGFSAAGLILT